MIKKLIVLILLVFFVLNISADNIIFDKPNENNEQTMEGNNNQSNKYFDSYSLAAIQAETDFQKISTLNKSIPFIITFTTSVSSCLLSVYVSDLFSILMFAPILSYVFTNIYYYFFKNINIKEYNNKDYIFIDKYKKEMRYKYGMNSLVNTTLGCLSSVVGIAAIMIVF